MSAHACLRIWLAALGALLGLVSVAVAQLPDSRPPNIILILADDVGYDDLACYGSKTITTLNIDRLAEQGMRFTSFYAPGQVCTPTRAAILTGCYGVRVGLPAVLFPDSQIGLSAGEITIARLLKQRGYATAIIGKWHLGCQEQFLPIRHGFDYWFGLPYPNDHGPQRGKGYPPIPLYRNEKIIEQPVVLETITERITDESIRFIKENREKPFFLYIAHVAAHTPWLVSEKFKGKSDAGPYGDFVQCLDWSVGQILRALSEAGLEENTLVVFASDNGPVVGRFPELEKIYGDAATVLPMHHLLRGGKSSTWEGGVRVPCIMCWPGRIPARQTCADLVAGFDLCATFASLAGAALPADRIIDGKNIMPLMTGRLGAKTPHEAFYYFRRYDLQAIRSGRWKLVFAVGQGSQTNAAELFDLENDIAESKNVAIDHPDVVKRLEKLAEAAREDLGDDLTKAPGKSRRPPGRAPTAASNPAR